MSRPADVRRLLEGTELPAPVRERIVDVVSRASLRATERVDVARELIAHFEDGLARGRSPEELLEAFGDGGDAARLIERGKRSSRSTRDGTAWIARLARDLRFAIRRLRKSPGFTVVAVLSLSLGIGANTAIFSVIDALLLSDPPVERPEELVDVYESSDDFPFNVMSYPDFEDLRDSSSAVFSEVAASRLSMAPVERGGDVETVIAELVTGRYFPMLGIDAAVGRTLGPEDNEAPGAHPVVMLSHGYWQRAFAGDPAVVGSELRIAGMPYTVVGVVEEEYKGNLTGVQPDLYVPVMMLGEIEGLEINRLDERRAYSYFGKARLRPGVTVEQAREALAALAGELRGAYPDAWTTDREFLLIPTRDVIVFPAFDGALRLGAWLILVVVGLVLLIACANLASFLLARAVDRRREIAVRLSLGAGRGQLVAQLLTETLLLSVVGGLAGVGLAHWMLTALESADLPLPLPMTFEFGLDAGVLGFAVAVSLAAGVLFGLAPALQATRTDLVTTLRDEAAGGGAGTRATLRSVLVMGQVAVSVVLLVGAGLFLRSLQTVLDIDPGIGSRPAGIVQLSLPATQVPEDRVVSTWDELESALRERPSVDEVGFTANLALDQTNNRGLRFRVDGVAPPPGQEYLDGDLAVVTPGFFDAAGIRILRGRGFGPQDDADARDVAIVSDAMARRYWPGGAAVGRTFRTEAGTELTVVGVAADTRMRTIGESPRSVVYGPLRQSPERFGYLVAATSGSAEAVLRTAFETVRERVPGATVFFTKTMDEHLAAARFPARLTAWVFGTFAALALSLAAIGLYGTVSYAQSQRVREVGIRMSLGADARSVVALLLRGGMRLVLVGGALGFLLALAGARVLSGLLYGVAAWDPVTFATVAVVLGAVALVASWVPARRAVHVDPVEALRSE